MTDSVYRSIILIGPFKIGKSTVALELRWKLDWPLYELDEHPKLYFEQIGLKDHYPKGYTIWDQLSPEFQPYHAHAVEHFIQEYSSTEENRILAVGGTQSVYEDEGLVKHIEAVFAPYDVVLLLPSEDREKSAKYLRNRISEMPVAISERWTGEQTDRLARHGVFSASNLRLAKIVVYTFNKTASAICDEICQRLNITAGNK